MTYVHEGPQKIESIRLRNLSRSSSGDQLVMVGKWVVERSFCNAEKL